MVFLLPTSINDYDSALEILLREARKDMFLQEGDDMLPLTESECVAEAMESQSIFDEFFERQRAITKSGSLKLEDAVDHVLSWTRADQTSDSALKFWQDQQRLKSLSAYARSILVVPASSAAVERVFSVGGNVLTPRRNRLSSERLSQLMVIKCNNMYSRSCMY